VIQTGIKFNEKLFRFTTQLRDFTTIDVTVFATKMIPLLRAGFNWNHWRLINNPFPAVLQAGSCLPVVIQYRATERCSRACELVIESDDPVTPVKILDILAYTKMG
jgi:hypothetical protein